MNIFVLVFLTSSCKVQALTTWSSLPGHSNNIYVMQIIGSVWSLLSCSFLHELVISSLFDPVILLSTCSQASTMHDTLLRQETKFSNLKTQGKISILLYSFFKCLERIWNITAYEVNGSKYFRNFYLPLIFVTEILAC